MPIKLVNRLSRSDHWDSEFYSGLLLFIVGSYGIIFDNSVILHKSFADGYMQLLPNNVWQIIFILIGSFQIISLRSGSILLRGIAAFLSSTLLLWGSLNVFVYGYFHFSLIAWLMFSYINLYALYKILYIIIKRKIKYASNRGF